MTHQRKIVISASRRTDIPAFYLDWFMDRLDCGFFKIVNPFNRHQTKVSASPDQVHTVVFWSKNFAPFLKQCIGEKLHERGYNLFFNFTVNSTSKWLEPRVPPLTDRLEQVEELGRRVDPRSITWRFDPICHFTSGDGKLKNNLDDFEVIAAAASRAGIQRCTTSFMDSYAKIGKRTAGMNGFAFHDPPIDKKIAILLRMETYLTSINMSLNTCCENDVLERLPPESDIKKGSCVPNDLLMELYGGHLSLGKDSGQRTDQGCGCMVSKDIGAYHQHPCFHNCLFCYANPSACNTFSPRNFN